MRSGSTPQADGLEAAVQRDAHRQRLEAFLASRDAGQALTLDALRAGITLTAVVDAAARLACYADDALAIVQEEYRPALHCREGCWYCCCKPNVLASIPELLNILEHVRTAFSADARAALRERARQYRAQMAGRRVEDPTDESVPCPLLVDGRCSAYEVRPLICRGYNSTDVDACRRAHEDATALVPTFAMLKDVTTGATVGAAQQLEAADLDDALVDLGTALDIALDAGDAFSQSVIDGNGAVSLAPAENRSWVTELWNDVRETARSVGVDLRGERNA